MADAGRKQSPRPRVGAPHAIRAGAIAVRQVQRSRILFAAASAAVDLGVAEMTATAIIARSGVSRRTFYELFEDRRECLLVAFEEGVTQARASVVSAVAAEDSWRDRLAAGLAALLGFIDDQPTLARFMVVDALGAGMETLRLRAAVIAELVEAVDSGRTLTSRQGGPSRLTAEGLVGAAIGILHARLIAERQAPLASLHAQLMSMFVRPYMGDEAAAIELKRKAPPGRSRHVWEQKPQVSGFRWTYRTIRVISAVAQAPGASNREVGALADIVDPGQMSKLLARLAQQGLIANHAARPGRESNAWRLTPAGAELENVLGGQLSAPSSDGCAGVS